MKRSIKDLYLDNIDIVEKFELDDEKLELFSMMIIYGKEIKDLPYDYIKEKGLHNVKCMWNEISSLFKLDNVLIYKIFNLINKDGYLDLYEANSFVELSRMLPFASVYEFKEFPPTLANFYQSLLSVVDGNTAIEMSRSTFCNDTDLISVYKNPSELFSKDSNPYFDKLFVKYSSIEDTGESKILHEYVKPTKCCLELLDLYKGVKECYEQEEKHCNQ